MDASKHRPASEGGTISWSAEAVLAAGIVAGSVITRLRNPKAALLIAAGALVWRAMKPRQWPAPRLAPPRERVPEEPLTIVQTDPAFGVQPSAPVIEATTVAEPVSPVVPAFAEAEAVPEVVTGVNRDTMALPPALDFNLLAIEEDFKALSDSLQSTAGDDAWILGLEPMPVVEELPAHGAFTEAVITGHQVHEHRPMIAEGAPLPDMIEISVEPALQGLQMAMSPSSLERRPQKVNEGPMMPPTVEPAAVSPEVLEEAPLIAPASIETGALELFGGFLAAASVDHLVASAASAPAADETAKRAMEWASFEVQPPEARDEPLTLRPMPRTTSNNHGGEAVINAKRNAVFGMPLPLASVAKAGEEAVAPAPEQPRRIVPHAPVSTSADDPQKSWLTWWK